MCFSRLLLARRTGRCAPSPARPVDLSAPCPRPDPSSLTPQPCLTSTTHGVDIIPTREFAANSCNLTRKIYDLLPRKLSSRGQPDREPILSQPGKLLPPPPENGGVAIAELSIRVWLYLPRQFPVCCGTKFALGCPISIHHVSSPHPQWEALRGQPGGTGALLIPIFSSFDECWLCCQSVLGFGPRLRTRLTNPALRALFWALSSQTAASFRTHASQP